VANPSTSLPARELARRSFILLATVFFLAITAHRFYWLGGPWFEIPQTIQDHVYPVRFPSRDAIILCRRVEPILARGVEVTVLHPSQAPGYDQTHWLTGLGLLPKQNLVPPDLEGSSEHDLTDFVVAIAEPLPHESYHLVQQFPEGRLYEVNR
jgi:hypothetical protein